MSPDSRGSGHRGHSRRLTLAAGTACLLVAGLIAPLSLSGAQAGPSAQPRTTPPASTLAVIKVIGVGDTPLSVAVDSVDDTVYVANQASDTLTVINGRTATEDATIDVGDAPTGVAVNQIDDTVYVTNQDDSLVSVINGRTATEDDTIAVVRPFGVAVNLDDDTVYVTNFGPANTVSIINGRSLDDSRTIPAGAQPFGVAVDQDDDTIYVTNANASSVSVINGGALDDSRTIGVGAIPSGVAVNQTDDTVYVANDGDGTVSVIAGGTATVVGPPIPVGITPSGVAVDQTDDTVYVTNLGDNTVSVINGRAATEGDTITVEGRPQGVAVDDTGTNQGLVYVTSVDDSAVYVIGRVEPILVTPSGTAGSPVTIDVRVPQVLYDVDDATVASVSFGGTAVTPTALAGDTWQVTAPAGTPGTTVAVPVTVTFRGGLTASAGSFTLTTPAPPPPPVFPPSAPLNVTATSGDAQATLTWAAPASSGSFPVIRYEVRSTPAGGTCLVSALTCTVTGLTNGTTYTFQVRAHNDVDWGPWSTPSNSVTPAAPPGPPSQVVSVAGDASAEVTWAAPSHPGTFPVTSYEVRSTPAGGSCEVTTLSCTIAGLANGTAYTFETRARSDAGWGPWSTPSNSITPEAPPPPPPTPLITITGSRGTGADRQIVFVTGTSTGLTDPQVRAHVKLRGQADYRPGRLVDLATDGTFGWQRTTGKKAYVYFTGSGIQSNRVIIPAVRN